MMPDESIAEKNSCGVKELFHMKERRPGSATHANTLYSGSRTAAWRHTCNLLTSLGLFILLGASVSLKAQNPNNFDTAKIMSALKTTHDDLVMLSSHRGVHALVDGSNRFVPENSLEAVGLAAQAGLEIVEIDLKMTSDGKVILSHDTTWGRETCYSSHWYMTSPFDPFTAPGNSSNDATNPAISDVTLASMRSYWYSTYLRDSVSLSCGPDGPDDSPS